MNRKQLQPGGILISAFLTLLFGQLAAQNFQNICSPGITIFSQINHQQYALRWDSVEPLGNNDTLFHSFRAVLEPLPLTNCADTNSSGIFGKTVRKQGNGKALFLNGNSDTIFLETQAGLNDTWKFYKFTNGSYIEAKVLLLVNDTVFGIPEPVKVISFQAKNAGNGNIGHIFNQKQFKLSQNHGLTVFYDMRYFPNDTTSLSLAGQSLSQMGIQELTYQEVFNFEVGNVFHYRYTAGGGEGGTESNKIYTVLEKISYGNDSVDYILDYCERKKNFGPGGISYFNYHDTMTWHYIFSTPSPQNVFYQLPQEWSPANMFANAYDWAQQQYGDRRIKKITWQNYWFSPIISPHCWTTHGGWEDPTHISYYSESLGLTYDDYYCAGPIYWYRNEQLVYYNQAGQTWGTPLSTNCNTLLSTSEVEKVSQKIIVFPNPMKNSATFTDDKHQVDLPAQLRISDYTGRTVYTTNIMSFPFHFDRQSLKPGFYIWLVSTKIRVLTGKLVIE